MSPVTTRRYIVRFTNWTLFETVVPANNMYEALAKAMASYNTDGLKNFTTCKSGVDGWEAEFLGTEVQS